MYMYMFADQQRRGGMALDPVAKARAAGAAIQDVDLRKRHGQHVQNAERFLSQLVAAPRAGPQASHRLTEAAAGMVCDTKKVTADQRLRQRQVDRQGKGAVGCGKGGAGRGVEAESPSSSSGSIGDRDVGVAASSPCSLPPLVALLHGRFPHGPLPPSRPPVPPVPPLAISAVCRCPCSHPAPQ